jgi:glutathione S-transferase
MIYHLALPEDWDAAQAPGRYEMSSRALTLAEQGFIHCSDAGQWQAVRRAIYADVTSELVLLEIDPDRLASPVVRELGVPETGEVFPHVYGPIDVDAVVRTTRLQAPHGRSAAPRS